MSERCKHPMRWALLWSSDSVKHIIWHNTKPLLFETRREAREWAEKHFGYIRARADLKAPPHGWSVPRAVRVEVAIREVQS